ncbi:MAG: hypothetical protein R2724_00205 [Bryobacterales bacterium]
MQLACARRADHYANAGASEPVRITMPKGGYVPEFALASARGRLIGAAAL